MQRLRKNWFLIGLLVLIPAGLILGYHHSVGPFLERWLRANELPRWVTAVVLFLMAFTLDSRQITRSLKAPMPVLFAGLLNLGMIPLVAMAIVPLQQIPDFQIGLMIAASVPCTLASASVWTRKAKGDDAVSLLVTLTTNSLCVVVTPFWLRMGAGHDAAFDLAAMTLRLVYLVLLPTGLGQLARLPRRCGDFAADFKTPIGVVAQSLILLLVATAATSAGAKLAEPGPGVPGAALLLVAASCIGLHLFGMCAAWTGGGLLGFDLPRRVATVFAGSQKTLPIGILLATDTAMLGGVKFPFAIFPMIIYHASQLLIDTSIAQRLARKAEEKVDAPDANAQPSIEPS